MLAHDNWIPSWSSSKRITFTYAISPTPSSHWQRQVFPLWATIPHKIISIAREKQCKFSSNPYRFAFSSDLPSSAASLGSLPLNCFFYFTPTFPFRLQRKLRNSQQSLR
jgi:hypothetical protein